MGLLEAIGVLAVVVVALFALPMPRSWRLLAAPFVVPAWLAAVGVIDQVVNGSADCNESCGYTFSYVFAIVALVPAALVALVIGVVLAVRRRRT